MLNDTVASMKTTIRISDSLFKEARRIAARDRTTLKALVEEGLRRVIEERTRPSTFRLKKASFKGQGLHPDVAGASWETIRDIACNVTGSQSSLEKE